MSDPSSARDPVEELVEEFAARYRRGEHPSVTEYTDKYPELAAQIREIFPALLVMEQFGSVVGPPIGPFEPRVGDREALPEQLGDYRILREVGRGGMGVVYEAVQESLGRHVALKILPFHRLMNPMYLERFRREARAAAQLHHTNIVPVFGVGEAEGIHYYAMQFIQGQGLDTVLEEVRRLRSRKNGAAAKGERRGKGERGGDGERGGVSPPVFSPEPAHDLSRSIAQGLLTGQFQDVPAAAEAAANHIAQAEPSFLGLSPGCGPRSSGSGAQPGTADTHSELASQTESQYCRSVAQVGVQVAEALAYAHKQRILHRDIKPSNLLLDTQGTVWITDFGLAKAEGSDELTSTGDIVGTVRFMAPERFQGKADPRSDIYSLGITLYEMLTLRPAFTDSHRPRLVERVTHEEPPRPRKLDPHLPRDFETIVLKAIAKEPAHRYPSAEALAGDLRRFLNNEPVHARRVGHLERLWRWCRRNPVVAGLIAAAALSLSAGTGISSYFAIQAHHRAEEALRLKDRALENAYAAHMNLAETAWENGQVDRVLGLLDLYRNPRPGQADVRGWEWHYQDRLCHDDIRTFKTDSRVTGRRAPVHWKEVPLWWEAAGSAAIRRQFVLTERNVSHISPDRLATDRALNLAFSPDGARLMLRAYPVWGASGGLGPPYFRYGYRGWVKVWGVASGQEHGLNGLNGKPGSFSLAVSPDGTRRATVLLNKQTRTDSVQPSGPRIRLATATHLHRILFSSDGKRLAIACMDGELVLWDAICGKKLMADKAPIYWVDNMAFSPDGTMLACASPNMTVRIWDARTGQELRRLQGHTGLVLHVAFSPNGTRLVSLDENEAKLWDTANGRELGSLKSCHGLAFSPDAALVALAGSDGTVKLWEVTTGREVRTLMGHIGPVRCMVFSPDAAFLASAGCDGSVKLWDVTSGLPLRTIRGHTGWVEALAFSPDGTMLASYDGQEVKIWDAVSGQEPHTLADHSKGVLMVAFSTEGKRLASASEDKTVKVWDAASGRVLRTLKGHTKGVLAVAFSPDKARLASASDDMTIKIWDSVSGMELRTLIGHTGPVLSVAFSPDGTKLASASDDKTVKLWDIASGQELRTFRGHTSPVLSVVFSPDGTRLASGGDMLVLWDAARGTMRPLLGPSHIYCVAFSPDGTRLALAAQGGKLEVRDSTSGKLVRSFQGHIGGVLSVAFSPDGRRLVSAGFDGTVKVWDALSGQELRTLKGHTDRVHSVAFSPDGSLLASASWDGTVKLWDGRPLTPGLLAEREALGLVEFLFNQPLPKKTVDDRIQHNKAISEPVRRRAQAFAELFREEQDPKRFDAAARKLIRRQHLALRWYKQALCQAEAAHRLAPDNESYLNTMGMAQYRVGLYQQAVDNLTRCNQRLPGSILAPSTLAFLAMAHYRLGQKVKAQQFLKRLRECSAKSPNDEEVNGFLGEAEALMKAKADKAMQ